MYGPFNERIAVLNMMELELGKDERIDKYRLLFAETTRHWERVTVSAATTISTEEAALSKISSSGTLDTVCKTLPGSLQQLLEEILSSTDLVALVANLKVWPQSQGQGRLRFDPSDIRVSEGVEESRTCENCSYIQEIDDMGRH